MEFFKRKLKIFKAGYELDIAFEREEKDRVIEELIKASP
jgi:hypothetical protein